MGGGNPIQHVVVLMMENRSFDHMLGYLKQLNPNIDGLTGTESNPIDPSNSDSPTVTVSDNATYITEVDPGHSIKSTTAQLWGNGVAGVDIPPMNGFVKNYGVGNDSQSIMDCFNPHSIPALTTLATSFAVFDRWYASVPGPTQPNRMYSFSATSHGAGFNDKPQLVLGYPQRTIFESLYDAGHSFGIYFTEIPGALIMRRLRAPKFWPSIKPITRFFADCRSGTLPAYSFLEPRYFTAGDWKATDDHPPHDVSLGDQFIADVYEALRASPLWERTLLIITFDEHGGFYDHVPTPLNNVPNPDGIPSVDPPFNFDRLGVRVPTVMISPWISKGVVFHEPTEEQQSGKPGSKFDHTSVAASLKHLFNLPDFLTERDAWAATFHSSIITEKFPRTDCPLVLPVATTPEQKARRVVLRERDITEEDFVEMERTGNISLEPLSDLQYELLSIAQGLTNDPFDIHNLKTEHEGALYCFRQMKKFFSQNKI